MAALALAREIHRICRRLRLLRGIRGSVLFTLGAASFLLILLLTERFAGRVLVPGWAPLLIPLGCLLGFLLGCLRRVSPLQAALATDSRLELRERLSSAVDLLPRAGEDPMVDALVADAVKHAEAVDPRTVFPVRLPREARYLAGATLLLALAVFLPELPVLQSPRTRAERAAVRAEGERIQRVAREVRKDAALSDEELARRVAQNMERLGRDMASGRLDKKAALLRLHELTEDAAEAQRALARADAGKTMAAAGEQLKEAAGRAEGKEAERLREMAEALAREDGERAAETLREMAAQAEKAPAGSAEAQRLAAETRAMAEALSGTAWEQASRELQGAAQQLEQGQSAQAARALEQAGGT